MSEIERGYDMVDVQITEQDIASLSDKLAALIETLTPGEAAAFEVFEMEVASIIATQGSDVQAFDFSQLDTMGADAQRQGLNQQAGTSGVSKEQRAGVWRAVLSSLARSRGAAAS